MDFDVHVVNLILEQNHIPENIDNFQPLIRIKKLVIITMSMDFQVSKEFLDGQLCQTMLISKKTAVHTPKKICKQEEMRYIDIILSMDIQEERLQN